MNIILWKIALGMSSSINVEVAITFSSAFYLGLAAGRSVQNAFDQCVTEWMLLNIPEENASFLLLSEGVNFSKVFIFRS